MKKHYKQILPSDEHYCIPKLNEIRFIGHRQTLSLVLGSCISTVFVGGDGPFIISANHIVIANPRKGSIIATKSAQRQIGEILNVYRGAFGIEKESVRCLHLIGAGSKIDKESFRVPEENIRETERILALNGFRHTFKDTGSYFFATYSLYKNDLGVFIENKMSNEHISFTIDLRRLISSNAFDSGFFPASMLSPMDRAFDYLVSEEIVTFITGKRDRKE